MLLTELLADAAVAFALTAPIVALSGVDSSADCFLAAATLEPLVSFTVAAADAFDADDNDDEKKRLFLWFNFDMFDNFCNAKLPFDRISFAIRWAVVQSDLVGDDVANDVAVVVVDAVLSIITWLPPPIPAATFSFSNLILYAAAADSLVVVGVGVAACRWNGGIVDGGGACGGLQYGGGFNGILSTTVVDA